MSNGLQFADMLSITVAQSSYLAPCRILASSRNQSCVLLWASSVSVIFVGKIRLGAVLSETIGRNLYNKSLSVQVQLEYTNKSDYVYIGFLFYQKVITSW